MFGEDRGTIGRIGKRQEPIGNGGALRDDAAVGGRDDERVGGRGEGEDRADRARGDLRADREAIGDHRVDLAIDAAPAVGGVVGLLDGEGDAAAAGLRQAADQLQLGSGEGVVGGEISVGDELDHALPGPAQRGGDAEQFGILGSERADVEPVAAAVRVRARGGEAERAGLHRLGGEIGHAVDLACGGAFHVIAAAIAHDIGAQCGVGHVGAEIHRIFALAQGVEIVGEAFPVPRQPLGERRPGNILDAFEQLDQPIVLVGAGGGETNAAIAHRRRGDAVDRGGGEDVIPGDLAVVMGVDVDEARRDGAAIGVERLARGAGDVSDRDDLVVLDRDIAAEARGAGAVDDGAVGDEQVGHGGTPKSLFVRRRHDLTADRWGLIHLR